MPVPRLVSSRHEWLRLLVSLALFFVQGTVALAPLAEARQGIGASAHVESRNNGRHYAHNEANCAFCAVRTIHASSVQTPAPPVIERDPGARIVAGRTAPPAAIARTSYLSRAPPSLL